MLAKRFTLKDFTPEIRVQGLPIRRNKVELSINAAVGGPAERCYRMDAFEKNMGIHLSINETALSNDEHYTVVTNKSIKGHKGAVIAMIK